MTTDRQRKYQSGRILACCATALACWLAVTAAPAQTQHVERSGVIVAPYSTSHIAPVSRKLAARREYYHGTATRDRRVRAASWEESVIGPSVIELEEEEGAPEQVPARPREPNSNGGSTSQHAGAYVEWSEECDQWGCAAPYPCNPNCYLIDWSRTTPFIGVAGFKTQANYLSAGIDPEGQIDGSFGFQYGINYGARFPGFLYGQLGGQVGVRFIHSNLEGSTAGPDNRNQTFLTAGLFRRVDYGWQGGLVVDYLHDDWFFQTELLQLRGQLSFVCSPCHEFGFRFTSSQKTRNINLILPNQTQINTQLSTLDMYRFFYRIRFGPQARGSGEFYAGWSEDSDGMLGLHLATPLHGRAGLITGFDYVIPNNAANPTFANEGWNISMAIAWTPGRLFGADHDYYRPLFDVADNGTMFIHRGP